MSNAYSATADQQLDDLETGPDVALYNDVLDVIEDIFHSASLAQRRSQAVSTPDGIVFVCAVPGRFPMKVFWSHSSEGPRIEAVFPRP